MLLCGMYRLSTSKTLTICAVLFGCSQLSGIQIQPAATLRSIRVHGGDHDLSVEITATVPVTPQIETVTDPDRLIVDIPEVLPSAGLRKILVNRGQLKGVRVGLLSAKPRITRIVLDLMGPATPYRLLPKGNTLVVKLGDESGPEPARVAAIDKPPVDARPTESKPAIATAPLAPFPTPSPAQSPEPSHARWIFPILFTATVLAMLVIALVAHRQNKRGRRGL